MWLSGLNEWIHVSIDPTRLTNINFNYSDKSVNEYFTINLSTSGESNNKFKCKLCGERLDKDLMRDHVGQHILCETNNVEVSHSTCGYCGLIGCPILLKQTSGRGKRAFTGPYSPCPHFYSFNLAAVKKVSKRSPCTNRPEYCPKCKDSGNETVCWTYNFIKHYEQFHSPCNPPADLMPTEDEITKVKLFQKRP